LRWIETSPPHEHDLHECNCTKNAKERPSGEPKTIQQTVTLSTVECSLYLGMNWLTFGKLGGEDHTYFRFHSRERSVRIEMTLPGPPQGLVNAFFANLYHGNAIDTSCFINGHSPTSLDLSDLGEKYWLHACWWGQEGVRLLSDKSEMELWNKAFTLYERIRQISEPLLFDHVSSVDDVRDHLETKADLLLDFETLRDVLLPLVTDMRSSELFRLGNELDQEVERKVEKHGLS
jgi:hypothetical protein